MAEIKDLNASADKWQRVSSGAAREYEEGVKNPRKDWAANTAASESAYEQGVTQAISRKSFGKGVAAAGTAKWQQGAIDKGTKRWGPGIALAGDAYRRGFAPYQEVISRTTLPPRGPKGDPGNIQRVIVMAEALHNEKLKRQGA